MAEPFIPCRLAELPREEIVPAAQTAIRRNPLNRPRYFPRLGLEVLPLPKEEGAEEEEDAEPLRIARMTSKYWGVEGVRLGVAFLDNPPPDLRARILSHMNSWAQSANITFRESNSPQAEVRITRTRGQGYWSYLGTDILHIPAGQPTLNLDSFSMSTPESEYKRVVRHETGHTLGFPHEHMREAIVNQLDPQKTIVYFQQTQGWSPQTTRQQVLTPISEAELTGTAADESSIMCYQLPASITLDGQPIPGGVDINAQDYVLAAQLYPKAPAPPAPAPPPEGGKPPAARDTHITIVVEGVVTRVKGISIE